jgi:hypothetical protein
VRAAREQAQAIGCLLHGLGLGQDAAANGHHRIGGQHQRIVAEPGHAGLVLRRQGLEVGQALRQLARQLAPFGRLVDMGWHQMLRLDADLVEQGQPARRGGCQNQVGTAGHGFNRAPGSQGALARLGALVTGRSSGPLWPPEGAATCLT